MIHDTIPLSLKYYFHNEQDTWMFDFGDIAKQADRIVTISEHSKNDIVNYLSVDENVVSVIPNGVVGLAEEGGSFNNVELPAVPFVTYLGAVDTHKNIDIILNALSLNDAKDIAFVVIGAASDDVIDRALNWGLDPSLVFPMGRLSDSQIATVLSNSIALVMPSLQEGFGLPPFEAGLLKVPSICSDRPAHNELLSGAALFVDPFLPREWLAAIRRLQSDPALSAQIASAAEDKARCLTWERNTRSLIDLFQRFSEDLG